VVKRLVLVLGLAACGEPQPYACEGNLDCRLPGMQGVCTDFGFCAFADSSCASGLRYHESAGDLAGVCVGNETGSPNGLVGDTAGNPLVLQPTQTVDLSNANDDYTPSCGGRGGRDVFFQTQITARSRLYLDTKGSDFDAVLVISPGACTAMSGTSCVSGACPTFDQWSDVVSPGTYCIVVDQQGAGDGGTHLVLRSMVGPPADEVDFGMLSGDTCEASDWKGACTQGNTTDQTWFTMTCTDQPVTMTTCASSFSGELEAWGMGRTQLACGTGCDGLTFTIPAGPAWLVASDPMIGCGTVRVDFAPN
jgi:hypothetical protein